MSNNCGIKSLERMTALDNISMFTLIHLAKDNGVKLFFCKVNPNELVNVARPAIFHQENHFVFIKNGEAMPEGEYTGYVLTPKPINDPLPFPLAKRITGGKKGGGILAPIITAVATIVTGGILGPAAGAIAGGITGAAAGAHQASGGSGFDGGKGEFWRIGTGALTGATAASNPAISAASAAAGELPGAIKSGNYLAPITAGLGQYGANVGVSGFAAGAKGATGILDKTIAGVKGAGNALLGRTEVAPSARTSAAITTPAGYTGSVTIPGVGSTSLQGAQNLASGSSSLLPGKTSGGNGLFGTNISPLQAVGLGATALQKPPQYEGNVTENFSKAAQYLGNENFAALPSATRQQLEKYTATSLQDLAKEFYAPDDKGLRSLEESKQKAVDQLTTTYANYGQDPYSSSQAQKELTEINRQYDQAISEYHQQLQNNALTKAITFKQDILAKSMEQGNFDYEAAMELATYLGQEEQFKFALESKNYDVLQDVLAQIFSIGQYNPNRQSSTINIGFG